MRGNWVCMCVEGPGLGEVGKGFNVGKHTSEPPMIPALLTNDDWGPARLH